jgi:hypothetical protein
MESLLPITRFYSIYHVLDDNIVFHKEYPYHASLEQTLRAVYIDSDYKTSSTFKLTNMMGKMYEIDTQSFGKDVMEKQTFRNILFEDYVVPYKGAYILIVYYRTTLQQSIAIVKQSGYCKKSILQYHVLNNNIVDKRLLKPTDDLITEITEPFIGFRNKTISSYMFKKARISGQYKINFVNTMGREISTIYDITSMEEKDLLENIEKHNDVILEDFIVPYSGVYIIFSYYETPKDAALDLIMRDLSSEQTLKFYMRIHKSFYPYPIVRLNKTWPINELLSHQLMAYTGQQEFIDFIDNGSNFFILSENMDKDEFLSKLAKSMLYLEFQWDVSDEMKELVWKESQKDSFWSQYGSMSRIFGEYNSFIYFDKSLRYHLYNVSILRHRQLPNNPVVMMITTTSTNHRVPNAYTQISIVRPPTYWLWNIMHPEKPRLSKISLLMHSVTVYSMYYIYREVDPLIKTAKSAFIPSPFPYMEHILTKANEKGIINYTRGNGILITEKSMLFWTRWFNVGYYHTDIQQCISCGIKATHQCPCNQVFYCGLSCQIEHWFEEHYNNHI